MEPPTLIMAWKLLPSNRTGRPVGSSTIPSTTGKQHRLGRSSTKSARGGGIASPLWTRRAVAELIRKEYGILDAMTRGQVSFGAVERAKVPPSCRGQDPEEVRHWLEVTCGDESTGPPVRMQEVHWCDRDRRSSRTRRPQASPRGAASEDRGAQSQHPHEPDLDD